MGEWGEGWYVAWRGVGGGGGEGASERKKEGEREGVNEEGGGGRRRRNMYKFVGAAYVHGVMEGEGMELGVEAEFIFV